MAKRGRKPKNGGKNNNIYFGINEESAVLDYLNSDNVEYKNIIYNDILKPAFEKMIESLIHRYKLYVPDECYDETFNDTLSFLLTKMDKFDPNRGKRAYSYYGNVCKNYLIAKKDLVEKNQKRSPSYDITEEEFTNNLKYIDTYDRSKKIASESIDKMSEHLKKLIIEEKNFLNDDEFKLCEALIILLDNWDYILSTDGSKKLNRSAVLLFLREKTGLDTKTIRDYMKRFKREYLLVKDDIIN